MKIPRVRYFWAMHNFTFIMGDHSAERFHKLTGVTLPMRAGNRALVEITLEGVSLVNACLHKVHATALVKAWLAKHTE